LSLGKKKLRGKNKKHKKRRKKLRGRKKKIKLRSRGFKNSLEN
jgi:hypothetical protein